MGVTHQRGQVNATYSLCILLDNVTITPTESRACSAKFVTSGWTASHNLSRYPPVNLMAVKIDILCFTSWQKASSRGPHNYKSVDDKICLSIELSVNYYMKYFERIYTSGFT